MAFFVFTKTTFTAQVVFSANSKYDAQVKVFIASSKYDADLVVYKASSKYECGNNNGVWFFTTSKYDAKKSIFLLTASMMKISLFTLQTANTMQAGETTAKNN